jgi:hypothetical protein
VDNHSCTRGTSSRSAEVSISYPSSRRVITRRD